MSYDLFRHARRYKPTKKTVFLLTESIERWGERRRLGLFCISPDVSSFRLVLHQSLRLEVISLLDFFLMVFLSVVLKYWHICPCKKARKPLSSFALCFTDNRGVWHTVIISLWHTPELEIFSKTQWMGILFPTLAAQGSHSVCSQNAYHSSKSFTHVTTQWEPAPKQNREK